MTYLVKALRGDEVVSLVVDAENEAGAEQYALGQGYSVLGIRRNWAVPGASRKRGGRFSALLFSQELLALLVAGLSVVEALQALKSKRRYASDGVVDGIAKALNEGQPLSAAVSRNSQHFSSLYVATLQASERTGSLQEALRRYVDYQEQMDRIRKKLLSACMYPALLTLVGAGVVLFLLFYVVPRFSKVYASFSGELPYFSKLLLAVGGFIDAHGSMLLAAAASGGIVIAMAARTPAARRHLAWALRAFPAIAENVRLYEITRLYRTLGMLLKAGIPVTQAMHMLEPLLSLVAREKLNRAHHSITEGRSISAAMTDADLITPIGERMLLVGEKTGNMGHMMERLAVFHEEDLARWIEDFSKLFEPVLMLILGIVVGAIVVLMYMPIFELATAVQS